MRCIGVQTTKSARFHPNVSLIEIFSYAVQVVFLLHTTRPFTSRRSLWMCYQKERVLNVCKTIICVRFWD